MKDKITILISLKILVISKNMLFVLKMWYNAKKAQFLKKNHRYKNKTLYCQFNLMINYKSKNIF